MPAKVHKAKKVTKKSSAKASGSSKAAKKKTVPAKAAKKKAATKKAATKKATGAKAKVQAFIDKINKDKGLKGKVQVRMAGDVSSPYRLRRPTGVVTLDLALGGGFHAGGGVQVYGGESAGKTYLAFRTAGELQRNYGNEAAILILSTEIRPDKGFYRMAGCCVAYSDVEIKEFENNRIARGEPKFTAEERADLKKTIGAVAVIGAGTGDSGLDVIIKGLEEGFYQLVIIESLGALLTPDQDEGDVGDRVYGGSSVLLTNFQNKMYPLFMMDREDGSMLETTVLGINQARAVIGGSPKGPKERAAAGAYAWRHGQLCSLEVKKGAKIYVPGSNKTKVHGREVRWEIQKGKAGTHDGKKGLYNFYYPPKSDPVFWSDVEDRFHEWGIDTFNDLVVAAKMSGAVKVAGGWITWEEDGKIIHKDNGEEKFATFLVDNPELQLVLREKCLRASGLSVRYS
jgi:RecA/RadA recombinase